MREWLARIGHRPHESGIRLNVDCSNRCLLGLERRLSHRRARGRPVAIVGHSRGGHFAKALAHRRPELVSRVVSMGAGLDTPFAISAPTLGAVAAVRAVHGRTTTAAPPRLLDRGLRLRVRHHYRGAFPEHIPITSIFSKGDGVVRWEACVVPYARCVEVTGSHIGLACNRKAYRAVAKALAPYGQRPHRLSDGDRRSPPRACTRATAARGPAPPSPARGAITSRWISLAPS